MRSRISLGDKSAIAKGFVTSAVAALGQPALVS